jgi:hypothetical protein
MKLSCRSSCSQATSATFIIVCALLVSQFAVAASAEISQGRAHQLAAYYFARYFPRESCGGAALPTLRGEYWESTVAIGVAGTSRGMIRVHRRTGRVSYHGPFLLKPAVSGESLDRWAHKP